MDRKFGGSRGGFGSGRRFGGNRSFDRGPRDMHKVTCSKCGQECEVPFKPTEGRPVFCKDCFLKQKGITPREPRKEKAEKSEEDESEEESEDLEEEPEESEEEF